MKSALGSAILLHLGSELSVDNCHVCELTAFVVWADCGYRMENSSSLIFQSAFSLNLISLILYQLRMNHR